METSQHRDPRQHTDEVSLHGGGRPGPVLRWNPKTRARSADQLVWGLMPALLGQVDAEVASMTADGAYDGETVCDAVSRQRHPEAAVIIPPRATAVSNESTTTQRDRHIAEIEEHGRMGWQRRLGYNRRSLVETAMYPYKTVVGRRLRAPRTRCPISGPRRKSGAMCSTGWRGSACRPPPGSSDTRGKTGDAASDLFMHRGGAEADGRV